MKEGVQWFGKPHSLLFHASQFASPCISTRHSPPWEGLLLQVSGSCQPPQSPQRQSGHRRLFSVGDGGLWKVCIFITRTCYVTDTYGGRQEGMMPLRKDLGVCSSSLFPPASHCPFLPWASLPSSRGSTHGSLCRAWRVAASRSHCVFCPLRHILKPICSFPGAGHTGCRDGPATCSGTSCRVKNRGSAAPENEDRLPGDRKDHTPGTRAAGN